MGSVRRLGLLVALLFAALAPAATSAAVTKGTITPSRGAAGVTLGMTRAQVVAKLGAPLFENANGYMQYGPDTGPLFDVYRDVFSHPSRVRLIGISGWNFCFPGGSPCLYRLGGVGELQAKYGARLKIVTLESGEKVYRLSGRYRGCSTFTDISPARFKPGARLIMVFVGFTSGSAC
jgi:hypothetical protein